MKQLPNNKSPKEADKQVGSKLREIRVQQNMSQRDLASKLNITFQQIQKYEKGINRISVGTLYSVCAALGVPPIALLKDLQVECRPKIAETNDIQITKNLIDTIKILSTDDKFKVQEYIQEILNNQKKS